MRLIDAEMVATKIMYAVYDGEECEDVLSAIDATPTAIEIVRCDECYKRNTSWCPLADWTLPHNDDWCSYGKRRESEGV